MMSKDRIAQLERLANLRASGVLSDEEFDVEKARVLNTPEHPAYLRGRSGLTAKWMWLLVGTTAVLIVLVSFVLLTQRGAPTAELAPILTPSIAAPEPLAPKSQEPKEPEENVRSQEAATEVVAPKITAEWRSLRTRIREGWGTEPTFANRYVIIRVGCGTGCTGNIVGNHRTGELYPLGLGGEGYDQLQLQFDNASDRLTARWGDIETQTCVTQRYRWNGTDLVESSERETTPRVDFGCDELGE